MSNNKEHEREEKRTVSIRPLPTSRVFEFSLQEWNWVKYLAKNIEHPKWWIEFIATLSTAVFLSSLFGIFNAGTRVKTIAFIVAAVCFLPLIIVILTFWARDRNRMIVNKKDLMQYMDNIDEEYGLLEHIAAPPYIAVQEELQTQRFVTAPETEMKEIPLFKALYKGPSGLSVGGREPVLVDPWGCQYMPLALGDGALEYVTCTIRARGDYWRAGLKLEEPESSGTLPLVLTEKSFLFHTYRNKDGRLGIVAYEIEQVGSTKPFIKDILTIEEEVSTLFFECDYRSGIARFGFDNYRYSKQLKPSLLKKAFLLSWWDGSGADGDFVEFKDITYRVTYVGVHS